MKINKLEKLFSNVKKIKLENGFEIIYYEDKSFEKYYVEMTTRYGSLDYTYLKDGKEIVHNKGIAHFLEHVMFNMPYGDALSKFNEYLGSANAYTSYDKTSYLVQFSKNMEDNIKTLLDLVTSIHINPDIVEKEKGIIVEEVGLYDKDPDWKIFKNSLNNSLKNIKYKDDILGLREDVQSMTYEMLMEAYNDFYRPDNQYIVVVGPDVSPVVDYIKDYMGNIKNEQVVLEKIKGDEEFSVEDLEFKEVNDISQKYMNITYKYVFDKDQTSYETDFYISLYLDFIYSFFNESFIEAEEGQVIDYTFDYDNIVFSNSIMLLFFINNKDLDKFEKFLEDNFIENNDYAFDVAPLVNSKVGKLIKKFNDEVALAKFLNMLNINNVSLADYYKYLNDFSLGRVKGILEEGKRSKIINVIDNEK